MDKSVMVHIYEGIFLSHKKNEILPFATWVYQEDIMLNEISQREKANTIWFHLCVEFKEQDKQAKQKQTHRCRKQIDCCQIGGGLGDRVKNEKKLRSANLKSQNSHRYVNYSIRNIVSNIVVTLHGARWELELFIRGITL